MFTKQKIKMKNQLLQNAIEVFGQETGMAVEIMRQPLENEGLAPFTDAEVRLGRVIYNVEIRQYVNEVLIGQLLNENNRDNTHRLVVTGYVPAKQAKRLMEYEIQFIDTAGNAFLRHPEMFVFVTGFPKKIELVQNPPQDLFGIAGLQILFALLCKPELINAPYREIADAAGVALGTVAGWIKNLQRQGYILEITGKPKKLLRKKDLLERWVMAYTHKLRPKLLMGRYTAQRDDFWRTYDIREVNAVWGGERAAFALTNYLKPEIMTIYALPPVEPLLAELKLRKDEKGTVEIRKIFWHFPSGAIKQETVPPLLVYADLLATGDPRNIETANMIYNQEMKMYYARSSGTY